MNKKVQLLDSYTMCVMIIMTGKNNSYVEDTTIGSYLNMKTIDKLVGNSIDKKLTSFLLGVYDGTIKLSGESFNGNLWENNTKHENYTTLQNIFLKKQIGYRTVNNDEIDTLNNTTIYVAKEQKFNLWNETKKSTRTLIDLDVQIAKSVGGYLSDRATLFANRVKNKENPLPLNLQQKKRSIKSIVDVYRTKKTLKQNYFEAIEKYNLDEALVTHLHNKNNGELDRLISNNVKYAPNRKPIHEYLDNKSTRNNWRKKRNAIGATALIFGSLFGGSALAKEANIDHDIKITPQYDNTTGLTDIDATFHDTTETIFGLPIGLTDYIDNVKVEIYDDKTNLIDDLEFSESISIDEHGNSNISIDGLAPGIYILKIQATDSENDITTYTKKLNITSKDTDEDGLSDYKEWILGTDPNDSEDPYKSKSITDIPKNDIKDTSGNITYYDDTKYIVSFDESNKLVDKIVEKSGSPSTTPMDTYKISNGDGGTIIIPTGYTPEVIYEDSTGIILGLTPTENVDSDATILDLISEKISLKDATSSLFGPKEQKAHILEDTYNDVIPGIITMDSSKHTMVFSNKLGDDDETIYVNSARDTDPSEFTNNAWKNLEKLEKKLHQMGLVTYSSSGGSVTGGTTNGGSGGDIGDGGGSGN